MMFALAGVRWQRGLWEVSGVLWNQEQDTGIKVTGIVALREKWLAGIWGVFLDEHPLLKEDTGLLSSGSVTQVQSLNVPALSLWCMLGKCVSREASNIKSCIEFMKENELMVYLFFTQYIIYYSTTY